MEDWELLELSGPVTHYELHPRTGDLVLSIGPTIIIWDIKLSEKTNLRCHQSPVESIAISKDGQLLLTSEIKASVLITLWSWQSLSVITSFSLASEAFKVDTLLAQFINKQVIICENFVETGYKLSCYSIGNECTRLENCGFQVRGRCLQLMEINSGERFVCVENEKLVYLNLKALNAVKQFNFNAGVLQAEYIQKQKLFIILLENRTIIVLNDKGQKLDSISKAYFTFTAINIYKRFLFIGTSEGTILVYDMKDLGVSHEIQHLHFNSIWSLKIRSNSTMVVIYEDATVQVIDHVESKVLHQVSGHSLSLKKVQWADSMNFYSMSQEPYLFVWKNSGKGWMMQALNLSDGDKKLKALAINSNKTLICGFTQGRIKIFKPDSKFSVLESFSFDNSSVCDIHITHINKYIGILHKSGYLVLLSASFKLLAEVENREDLSSNFFEMREAVRGDAVVLYIAILRKKNALTIKTYSTYGKTLEKKAEKTIKIQGNCTGMDIHCSGQYILVSSDRGGILIISLDSAEVVGVLASGSSAYSCSLDPSGLYVCTYTEVLSGSLLVFEVGSGLKVSELSGIDFVVQKPQWHRSGNYILLPGSSGSISVWKCPEFISLKISKAIRDQELNFGFWDDFRINLELKSFKTKDSPVNLQEARLENKYNVQRKSRKETRIDAQGRFSGFVERHSHKNFLKSETKEKEYVSRGVERRRAQVDMEMSRKDSFSSYQDDSKEHSRNKNCTPQYPSNTNNLPIKIPRINIESAKTPESHFSSMVGQDFPIRLSRNASSKLKYNLSDFYLKKHQLPSTQKVPKPTVYKTTISKPQCSMPLIDVESASSHQSHKSLPTKHAYFK